VSLPIAFRPATSSKQVALCTFQLFSLPAGKSLLHLKLHLKPNIKVFIGQIAEEVE
jgi:hypothetical protein